MQDLSFEAAVELIRAKDPRYHREAYQFVRDALDHTQQSLGKDSSNPIRHVTGQQLLQGIRDYALIQFGPMAMTVLAEWGIHGCQDFGEIVFNMVESRVAPAFSPGDIKDVDCFAAKLKQQSDPVSRLLWREFSEDLRRAVATSAKAKELETALVKELNEILRKCSIYEEKRFADVKLSEQTRSLASLGLQGTELAQFNRLLLEDAYPTELSQSHGLLAKTENDTRADFAAGYDFCEAFRKPFLPPSKQSDSPPKPTAAPAPSR
jgi:uncharacterized repeat protein (TIGR04138 family)